MIMQYKVVSEQLITLGVPAEKIKSYHDLRRLCGLTAKVMTPQGNINICEWKRRCTEKSILVCSHEFSRTGVPVALMHVCIMLKEMGYHVLFTALLGGTFEQELQEKEIDYLTDLELFYEDKQFLNELKMFDLFFLGSIVTSKFGMEIATFNKPVVWWLHESDINAYHNFKLVMAENISYFAVGKRVVKRFNEFYPKGHIKELCYFLPDADYVGRSKSNKITFAVIGSINRRKAQDIFVEAIKHIKPELVERAQYVIVGAYRTSDFYFDLQSELENNPNLVWIDEMSQEEVKQFYKSVDVLVCPSRDDPLPIVVTQALQNGIPCIISDEVGQSEYIIKGKGGMVFPSENVKMLADAMTQYIENEQLIEKSNVEAKKIFESHFSEQKMRGNLEQIILI
jgi:glycosyltransferase involved in cell wall biosynthesis